jgi:hypothetical protein
METKTKRQRDQKQLRLFSSFINHALFHLGTLSKQTFSFRRLSLLGGFGGVLDVAWLLR